MESEYDPHPDFGITPAQYHHGLSKLWGALNMPSNPTGEDVFALAARAIEDAQQKPSRREIAAMAMQMFLQQTKLLFLGPEFHDREVSAIASVSVKMADALIERLNADPAAEGASHE
jgi:hypothetical protein